MKIKLEARINARIFQTEPIHKKIGCNFGLVQRSCPVVLTGGFNSKNLQLFSELLFFSIISELSALNAIQPYETLHFFKLMFVF